METLVELKEKLSAKGVISVRLMGTSMGPFVKNGALTLLKKVAPCDIRVGDIILYCIGEELFAHRVLKIGRDAPPRRGVSTLVLKADAVAEVDRNVSFEEVIGKIVLLERDNHKLDLQSSKWRIINYFILFYSFMLSILREKLKRNLTQQVRHLALLLQFMKGER